MIEPKAVGYTNGRIVIRRHDDNTALYNSAYRAKGDNYRASSLVYDEGGEWKIMFSIENQSNGAIICVRTQTARSWEDACKRAYRFVAYAENTGNGVEI